MSRSTARCLQQPAETATTHSCLSLPTFLAAYTSGSARINGLDGVTGCIRPGLAADFAIVDADLSHIPAAEVGTATVTGTWIRGVPMPLRKVL